MIRRLLAVDVGNTHTTLGFFEGNELRERWRIATRVPRTGDELWVMILQFLRNGGREDPKLTAVSIASVVPELTYAYTRMSAERLGIKPLVITVDCVRSLRVNYDPPSSVGADRLCGAVAAVSKYHVPLVVLDIGTAMVFDVIGADGAYRGGIIAPGLETGIEALHSKAALLPRVETVFPPSVVGRNTEEAIQSGVLHGAVVMIEGMLERIERELGSRVTVVATGGFAEILQLHCGRMEIVEPNLVLEGIRLITDQQ
jgi:type III pantothenate kinase